MVSTLSKLIISNTTFQASQRYAVFHLRNETDANFTLTVNSNHNDTDSSTPETIQLTSMYQIITSRVPIRKKEFGRAMSNYDETYDETYDEIIETYDEIMMKL